MKNNALIFLTYQPNEDLLEFALELSEKSGLSIFVMVDDNKYIPNEKYKKLIVQIDDKICMKNGFRNSNFVIKKDVTSWDKVLFFLCRKKRDIDFCWIVEDDVFIPSVKSVKDLTKKYNKYDLVVSGDEPNVLQKRDFWHWRKAPKYLETKFYSSSLDTEHNPERSWYKAMVPAVGISRTLLYLINLYALSYKQLMFIEFMFNTIAHQANLDIKVIKNFDTITWRTKWKDIDITNNPDNWFHPVKDFSLHPLYREYIKSKK